MPRVLTISSQVVYGPVGNSAAVPALQSFGHDVLSVPTVLLSHHPGHGQPVVQKISAQVLRDMLASVEQAGGFTALSGVLTGYFAHAEQVDVVCDFVTQLKQRQPDLKVLVDPVLGDHGKLYVAEAVADAIKVQLVPLASILTPNAFELSWLSGRTISDRRSALEIAQFYTDQEVIVTSVPDAGDVGSLLVCAEVQAYHRMAKLAHVPNGTGDFLAGCYLGARLTMAPASAFEMATRKLEQAVHQSAGSTVLKVN